MHQELKGWLEWLGMEAPVLTALHGDASGRRYYRLENHAKKLMVMDASDEKASVPIFIGVGWRLMDAKVRIPTIRAYELNKGFILLEDVGSTHLFDFGALDNPSVYYEKAIKTLVQMQETPSKGLEPYDQSFLLNEMNLMLEWYLKAHLGQKVECVEGRTLLSAFMLISKEVLAQPQETFVHRDYHAKNLMIDSEDEIVVIDFQDAREGGITYDLVSLLQDAYVLLDARERNRLIKFYKELKGIEVDEETFMRWFDFTGLQRHIKILGIFARLSIRDGKDAYLDNIPLVLQYILEVAQKYPELQGLVALLTLEEQDSVGFF
ncbi:MAG: COG3178: Predicted phosphotransferase related to Ser/Thr protein kinases [uncultured Sulfurovum sp.]|uniref:COG3178: Predicted phosphotransferase related to Ser/Thr protein kinases n=1 Tax=uncultured Sulfurovum sp. TaxID=269237 RepID=A0A6S6T1K8_9BACT|nr:MAG: COG3178: Predicted phosphotransferase related to Ser/Thr protein kinases [uncultured Sulfurovum sp.]